MIFMPQGERRTDVKNYLLDVSKFFIGGAVIGNVFADKGSAAIITAGSLGLLFCAVGLCLSDNENK